MINVLLKRKIIMMNVSCYSLGQLRISFLGVKKNINVVLRNLLISFTPVLNNISCINLSFCMLMIKFVNFNILFLLQVSPTAIRKNHVRNFASFSLKTFHEREVYFSLPFSIKLSYDLITLC